MSPASSATLGQHSAPGPVAVTLPINEQPFGELQLVDEIDTAAVALSQQIRRRQQRPGRRLQRLHRRAWRQRAF